MEKRIQQCTTSAEKVLKEIKKYKANLRCFNSSLTWEKSFHDLKSSNKSNIPLDIVTKYVSLVKENIFYNIKIFHELNNLMKRRLQNFLVLNFPILELTWELLELTILINVHKKFAMPSIEFKTIGAQKDFFFDSVSFLNSSYPFINNGQCVIQRRI